LPTILIAGRSDTKAARGRGGGPEPDVGGDCQNGNRIHFAGSRGTRAGRRVCFGIHWPIPRRSRGAWLRSKRRCLKARQAPCVDVTPVIRPCVFAGLDEVHNRPWLRQCFPGGLARCGGFFECPRLQARTGPGGRGRSNCGKGWIKASRLWAAKEAMLARLAPGHQAAGRMNCGRRRQPNPKWRAAPLQAAGLQQGGRPPGWGRHYYRTFAPGGWPSPCSIAVGSDQPAGGSHSPRFRRTGRTQLSARKPVTGTLASG